MLGGLWNEERGGTGFNLVCGVSVLSSLIYAIRRGRCFTIKETGEAGGGKASGGEKEA